MTNDERWSLLRDVAALVRKYGPDRFTELALFLKSSDTIGELIAVLEATASAGRRARVATPSAIPGQEKKGETSLRHFLSTLENDDPEKARLLLTLYEALAAKRALPTLRDLRSYAHDNGLKPVSAASRDKAIGPFIRDLASRSLQEIRSLLAGITQAGVSGDRSLEGWTDVILNRQRGRGDT